MDYLKKYLIGLDICTELEIKDQSVDEKLRAISFQGKLWDQKKTINICFLEEPSDDFVITDYALNQLDKNDNIIKFDPLQIEIINNYVKFTTKDIIPMIKRVILERYQPIVNLKFEFVNCSSLSNIKISFDKNKGSNSYVGNQADKIDGSTMNFAWFSIDNVLHEFGHALGLVHEHQSPFGKPIPWNKPLVYDYYETVSKLTKEEIDTNIIGRYSKTIVNGTDYDPKSIMLYSYPKILTTDFSGTSKNVRLSPYDVKYINSLYPGSSKTPEEFYKEIYNEDISKEVINIHTNLIYKIFNLRNLIIFVATICFIIAVVFIVRNEKKLRLAAITPT